MMTNEWKVIDANGTIHSGTEEEMLEAFDCMTDPGNNLKSDVDKWRCPWSGDLELIEVHNSCR